MFSYNGFTWTPLESLDSAQAARDLNDPAFVAAALRKYPNSTLLNNMRYRHQQSRQGERLHLMLMDDSEKIRGWVGLLRADSYPALLETSIFLHPDLWGQGVSKAGYSVLLSAAAILGHDKLIASVDEGNVRSLKAHERLFPLVQRERIYEPSKKRWSVNFFIEQRLGPHLDREAYRQLEKLLSRLHAYERLRVRL